MQDVNYERFDGMRRRAFRIAYASISLAVVFLTIAFTPIHSWIAGKVVSKPPMFTAVKVLAEELYDFSTYTTAVKLDPESAEKCDFPNINKGRSSNNVPPIAFLYTPVPTLTEFIISEKTGTVCIVVNEERNRDSSNNPSDPNLAKIRRADYATTFGKVPLESEMVRVEIAQYKIGSEEFLAISSLRPLPNLFQMYSRMERAMPPSMNKKGYDFILNRSRHLDDYIEKVRYELGSPQKWSKAIFQFIGCQGILMLFIVLHILWRIYLEYQDEMRWSSLPISKFHYFISTKNTRLLTERLISYRREKLRAENEAREVRRAERRLKIEAGKPQVQIAKEETPEQRLERRRRKIEGWCHDLRNITPLHPPSEMKETERLCALAKTLVETDFDRARGIISEALRNRKFLNEEQDVVT